MNTRTMKHIYASIPFLIAVLFLGVSALIGTSIDSNGMLIEKGFFLIPLAYLMIADGVVSNVWVYLKSQKTEQHI